MRKLVSMVLIIFILSISTNCAAPPTAGAKEKPDAVAPNIGAAEVKRDEIEEKAEALLGQMTLEEKMGQLLIVGFPQDTQQEVIHDYIDNFKVSGFILFKRNYKDFDSQYTLVKNLKERNSIKNQIPLFISVDEEGGTVTRLPKGGTVFPDAQLIGNADKPELTYNSGNVIGKELMVSGINMNYAPVLDIVLSSNSKLLVKRSYGNTAEKVSKHGASFISGLQAARVIAAPKHFPGHGSTNVDSHGKLPVINIDKSTFETRELAPFRTAINSGLDAIMIGHLAYPKLDPTGLPATMSRYFLTDVLRKEIDFKGIAISDEIEMYGYMNGKSNLEENVATSFNSGLDIFVIGHTKKIQDRVLKALKTAYAEGRISEERLNESVLRILKVKLKHKLTDKMEYSLEDARSVFGSKEHKTVLEELKKAIKEKGR